MKTYKKYLAFLSFVLTIILAACAHQKERTPAQANNSSNQINILGAKQESTPDYPRIFAAARNIMARPAKKVITAPTKLKDISESSLVSYMIERPQTIPQIEQGAIDPSLLGREIWEEVGKFDPTKHLRLIPPKGQFGYTNLKLYVNHPYYMDGRLVPASDLRATWRNFILQAKKEIMVNVFDFDLMPVAEALAAKAKAGLKVTVGIDNGVINHRKEVAAVKDFLEKNKVKVVAVNSVKLNHQKMTILDWSDKKNAKVLISSGNLTQSCIGPEGDLVNMPPPRHEYSIPNANHLLTMNSWLLANLIHHELSKTLDDKFLLRGAEYPISGSYQITGPGVNPETLEAYPTESLVIAFSPGGGVKSINKTLIARMIQMTKGPVYMLQFAYSSEEVAKALRVRANEEYTRNKKFEFYSIGDTPFAMQYWSQFLKMSGLELTRTEDGKKIYEERDDNLWLKEVGPERVKQIRSGIFIAPRAYKNHNISVNGVTTPISAKIHHKMLVSHDFAIMGTSFNFSTGAETNNEQLVLFKSPQLAKIGRGMFEYFRKNTNTTVYEEAQRRNRFAEVDTEKSNNPEDLPGDDENLHP